MSGFHLGVDVGGTFTDFVLTDDDARVVAVHKLLTTPDEPSAAIIAGARELLGRERIAPADVRTVVHGTTLAANAIIQRTGAPTALLTTRGFRDVLEMGSEQRYDIHDLFLRFPVPLVPRHRRIEVGERLTSQGSVLAPLPDEEVRAGARTLVAEGVRSVAIAFLHSYVNREHEVRAAALVREVAPELAVSMSHAVAPELREYERTSTTVANAYIAPLVGSYLRSLTAQLAAVGIEAPLLLMLSDGGTTTERVAAELPVRILESGPAGGALAAAHQAAELGANVLSFDMGGTTAKVCLLRGGQPARTAVLEVARTERFKAGSGLPIRTPAIDLLEVGGGGGSIARVDRLGLLKVGPDSAGAKPGPACYPRDGNGELLPTVTDAALVLGYLGADSFLGGRMTLDADAARRAIRERLAEPLGMSLEEAAWGVYSVVSESMASAARIHCIEHGVDPRSCVLFAFGGAGPMHAAHVARILRMPRAVCPAGAGVASAFGFLVAPLSFSESRSLPGLLDGADLARVHRALDEMAAGGRARLRDAGVADADVRIMREADCSLLGQSHELAVPVPDGQLDATALGTLGTSFRAAYRTRYGHPPPAGTPVQVLTWRVTAVQRSRAAAPPSDRPARDAPAAPAAPRTERAAYFPGPSGAGYVTTSVYRRADLPVGAAIAGPAIVEENEATTVVPPGRGAWIDPRGNLVIAERTGS